MTDEELEQLAIKQCGSLGKQEALREAFKNGFEHGQKNEFIKEYLEKKVADFEEQIEKMKCCENCKHQDSCYAGNNNGLCEENLDKWELAE